jgi:hypothetical protein
MLTEDWKTTCETPLAPGPLAPSMERTTVWFMPWYRFHVGDDAQTTGPGPQSSVILVDLISNEAFCVNMPLTALREKFIMIIETLPMAGIWKILRDCGLG